MIQIATHPVVIRADDAGQGREGGVEDAGVVLVALRRRLHEGHRVGGVALRWRGGAGGERGVTPVSKDWRRRKGRERAQRLHPPFRSVTGVARTRTRLDLLGRGRARDVGEGAEALVLHEGVVGGVPERRQHLVQDAQGAREELRGGREERKEGVVGGGCASGCAARAGGGVSFGVARWSSSSSLSPCRPAAWWSWPAGAEPAPGSRGAPSWTRS